MYCIMFVLSARLRESVASHEQMTSASGRKPIACVSSTGWRRKSDSVKGRKRTEAKQSECKSFPPANNGWIHGSKNNEKIIYLVLQLHWIDTGFKSTL